MDAKPVYRAVKTFRLFEQIVQQVEDSILKGQLKPGDQLPAERDLAQRFGVSRTAVREAVKTLREKDLAELRLVLEPEIAALAVPRIEEQLLTTMREAIAAMDRNLNDPEAYVEADLDFHLALAEAAGNPLILSLLDSIVGLLREQRSRIFNVEGGPERGQYHHKRILAAIDQRDPEAARDAMRAHLKQVLADSSSISSK